MHLAAENGQKGVVIFLCRCHSNREEGWMDRITPSGPMRPLLTVQLFTSVRLDQTDILMQTP